MKTPEQIKLSLKLCVGDDLSCTGCPYNDGICQGKMEMDALAYIQQLESRLAQVERERDELLKERCSE